MHDRLIGFGTGTYQKREDIDLVLNTSEGFISAFDIAMRKNYWNELCFMVPFVPNPVDR